MKLGKSYDMPYYYCDDNINLDESIFSCLLLSSLYINPKVITVSVRVKLFKYIKRCVISCSSCCCIIFQFSFLKTCPVLFMITYFVNDGIYLCVSRLQSEPSASIMNVGTAHSEVNPNTRVMNSRGMWLSYILGIGLLHIILLSIPVVSVPVVWTLTNLIHNLVSGAERPKAPVQPHFVLVFINDLKKPLVGL